MSRCGQHDSSRTLRSVTRLSLLLGIGVVLLAAVWPLAAGAEDDRDVRVVGVCGSGSGVTSKLRLKSGDDGLEVRFEVEHARAGVVWRVVLVHERRIAWRGSARTTRSSGSFEVRRVLRDLPGSDAVSARAWGPRGVVCRAAAVLPGS
jgi:hypothetical protein